MQYAREAISRRLAVNRKEACARLNILFVGALTIARFDLYMAPF